MFITILVYIFIILGGTKLSNVNILYIIMGVVVTVLIIVLVIICVCIRCTMKKITTRRNSSRKASTRPSEADVPIDPEMVCSDTKTPMLAHSQTGNSTFLPYDYQRANRYSELPSVPPAFETGFDHPTSTMSSKYSYNSPLHSSLHHTKQAPSQDPYDLGSCLTSL